VFRGGGAIPRKFLDLESVLPDDGTHANIWFRWEFSVFLKTGTLSVAVGLLAFAAAIAPAQ
jgi:hypothetical protein